jgi:hypothetical protein
MIENNTPVRHKILGYEGVIDGETRLKMLFTGERGVASQYRIKVPGQDKRFIAPEEDLEIRKVELKVKKSSKKVKLSK